MRTTFPKFRVEIPFGRFSCRRIISRPPASKKQTVVGAGPEERARPVDVWQKRIPWTKEPKPRTASDFFLHFMRVRQIDRELLTKHPMLASFLDAAQTIESRSAEGSLELVKILAKAEAPELALCAGLFWGNKASPGKNEEYLEDVMACGERLGVPRVALEEAIKKVRTIDAEVEQTRNGIGLTFGKLFGYRAKHNKRQIANLVNLTRTILKSKESKYLYGAIALSELCSCAEFRYPEVQSWLGIEAEKGGIENDRDMASFFGLPERQKPDLHARRENQFFLQVLPVVEELGVQYLTERLKDQYLKAFDPAAYWKINRWFEELFGFDYIEAERHIANVVRLIYEAGIVTGSLPRGAMVKGRVKSLFSIYEKMLRENLSPDQSIQPSIGDIFGIRILVQDIAEVKKVARFLRSVYLRPDRTLAEVGQKRSMPPTPEDMKRLRLLRKYIRSTRAVLNRRGFVNFERDSISTHRESNRKHGRVPYHYMILTTYRYLPLEAQITTYELEQSIDREKPHWKFKFLTQLAIEKMSAGIKKEDLSPRKGGVYVVFLNERSRTCRIEFIPSDAKTAADFPRYQRIEGNAGPLQNGEILIKKAEYTEKEIEERFNNS